MAQLSGIPLSPELLGRYSWHLKNHLPASDFCICTCRLFGEPSSSCFPRLDPLAPYCYTHLSWDLICPTSWHFHFSVALLAGWLPSPSSSAPAIGSTVTTTISVPVVPGIALPPWAIPMPGKSLFSQRVCPRVSYLALTAPWPRLQ